MFPHNIGPWAKAIEKGELYALAKSLSLVESPKNEDAEILNKLFGQLPKEQVSLRVGICGIPGVGKSSFIEKIAMDLLKADCELKIAVITIDPSSPKSGGALLGDKTRMNRLASEKRAFIRPFSTIGQEGGLMPRILDAIRLFEKAGYSLIFVETTGIMPRKRLVHQGIIFST